MIYVRLKGGMGNQLFQYALGRQLAWQLGVECRFDLTNLLNRHKGPDFVYRDYDLDIFHVAVEFMQPPGVLRQVYKLKHSRINKFMDRLAKGSKHFVKEAAFHFQPQILAEARDETLYEGWFQSPKYFAGVETELRQEIRFKQGIETASQALLERIKTSNSVCLNVRRTDFLQVDTLNATTLNYFLEAGAYVGERVQDPHFFIFSDDVAWCQENIKLPYPLEVVDHRHKGHKFGNYLQLMASCDHFIVPNSSFAWWAVWLRNNSDGIVVAPKNWFTDLSINTSDLVPAEWARL